jgi:cbb3-type cytochrome oxidase subunit 1
MILIAVEYYCWQRIHSCGIFREYSHSFHFSLFRLTLIIGYMQYTFGFNQSKKNWKAIHNYDRLSGKKPTHVTVSLIIVISDKKFTFHIA